MDVRLVIADADAQVHVWHGVLGNAGWPRLCQRRTLRDAVATPDEKRPEMSQGRPVAVRFDRDGEPVRRNLSGERDFTRNRGPDRATVVERNVDTAMLSGGVRVVAEREVTENGAVRRPRPGLGVRSESECDPHRGQGHSQHSRCPRSEHASTVAAPGRRGNAISQSCHRVERYRALRDAPVRRTTRSTAWRCEIPAATSSATAPTASSSIVVLCALGSHAQDQRDLPLRRLGEALGELAERPSHDFLEALRQLAADGGRSLRHLSGERRQREAGRRRGDSNATTTCAPARAAP